MGNIPEIKKKRGFEDYIAAFLLILLTVLLSIQVFVRFAMGGGLAWTEELSRYVFIWSIYFGCILAAKEDKHIRVTALVTALPKRWEGIIITVSDITWVAFNGFIVFHSGKYIMSMFRYPFISQTMGFNIVWVYTIIPLGYFMMLVYVARMIFIRIKKIMHKEDVAIIDSRLGE